MGEIRRCRWCSTTVAPKADGLCPACGRDPHGDESGETPVLPWEAMAGSARTSHPPASAMTESYNTLAAQSEDEALGEVERVTPQGQSTEEIRRRYTEAKMRFHRQTAFWIMLLCLGGTIASAYFFMVAVQVHNTIHLNLLGLVVACFIGFVWNVFGWWRGTGIRLSNLDEHLEDQLLP